MSKTQAQKQLTCRPFDADEWMAYRDIRLEALQTNPEVFSSNHAREKTFSADEWRERITSDDCVVFGLFHGDEAVGCIGVGTMREDKSGESAVLWGTFVKPAYRGHGLSGPLYKTLIAYAKTRKDWKQIVVSHRESNEASKRATLAHGFEYTHTEDRAWPDGKTEAEPFYRLNLK
jgi:RimJ/RimL family protein N-acetyltransferase